MRHHRAVKIDPDAEWVIGTPLTGTFMVMEELIGNAIDSTHSENEKVIKFPETKNEWLSVFVGDDKYVDLASKEINAIVLDIKTTMNNKKYKGDINVRIDIALLKSFKSLSKIGLKDPQDKVSALMEAGESIILSGEDASKCMVYKIISKRVSETSFFISRFKRLLSCVKLAIDCIETGKLQYEIDVGVKTNKEALSHYRKVLIDRGILKN